MWSYVFNIQYCVTIFRKLNSYIHIFSNIDPDSISHILNEDQIFERLNEDIENIDEQFEQSERIINNVELQEIGDTSIFTIK